MKELSAVAVALAALLVAILVLVLIVCKIWRRSRAIKPTNQRDQLQASGNNPCTGSYAQQVNTESSVYISTRPNDVVYFRNVDVMEKTETDLKDKQRALKKACGDLKKVEDAVQQADIQLKETQTHMDIYLNGMQEHCRALEEIYDFKKTSEVANSVQSVHDDLKGATFINWIKGTLALKFLTEGVRHFVYISFVKFQRQDLPDAGSHFDNSETINRLAVDGVKWTGTHWKYLMNMSHCDVCKGLFEKVKLHHRHFNTKAVFNNCKILTFDGAWGIAKLFMPPGCRDVKTPEELDAQALLKTIMNCNLFQSCNYENVEKIQKLRNAMMHSPDLTLTDDKLKMLYDCGLKLTEEMISQNPDESNLQQKLRSARDDMEHIYNCVMEIKTLVLHGQRAMEYEHKELEKQSVVVKRKYKIQEKQTRLQNKLGEYMLVEKAHARRFQQTNSDVVEDMELTLNKLKETIYVLENTKRELDIKLRITKTLAGPCSAV